MLAHRVSWILTGRELPDAMKVLHECDNVKCVRPSHLFLGSQAENVRDMIAKGRAPSRAGENNGRAVLNAERVRQMRRRYASGLFTHIDMAREFGVSAVNVGLILRGQTWRVK